ncbi:alpha-1,3-mannosyl-glycoprotein 4-beta-N-acetylglucosaminyltransferase C [Salarias fasciatus]|uniref:Alpha-1,3-mannosyl-glycoprotein 4-beta-N-acetylglucosaminyltransferase C-like n=1 Tax=Salarias fasciatus TaxID=181472 RepID=A0A672I686_SALFA|nr:alpha-1,3-mannosyl-glycoprotein 4-beta-N-acetylglucosaminyltransferase C-like [Salarias fasciatus]XP_029975477.1 alpha-1,3-mannosyl-glycoprotein 4-beta-N-acetylglucosaminyltransferase C-like [Salarias fasciatus]XP_029975478.1 alpha-1,3-mannosyl-glycoprotein 4-beta-N-acetylglucosaminyltransferase C-like [Salarias fasciatus]
MRCLLKKKNILVAVLLLIIGGIYLMKGPLGSSEPAVSELSRRADRLVSQESWVEQGDFLPLNVSYQLLAGTPATRQKYLAIGLSSVKRKKGSYLASTLRSIFSQSSAEERASMVAVVLLADFDVRWRVETVKELKTEFQSELEEGQLIVVHVSEEWYPAVTGLKRNYNDPPDRVTFRSKQNLDYSFLIHYSSGLGRYYLQLEDDISCAKNFFTTIKKRVEEQEAKKTTWATLEFSALGYIGKLYKSVHLPLLSRFLFLFYQEMPCDWLLTHFREVMTQREQLLFKPSLFQHMGIYSSYHGNYNKLKDKDFEEGFYANPPARVFSNMSTYQDHAPQNAWDAGEKFFWGRSPAGGDYLTAVLSRPALLTWVSVETGSGGKDFLQSARVELGTGVVSSETEQSCTSFEPLGEIKNGKFEMQEVDRRHSSASSCVRILVTAAQNDWVIIRKIRITEKPGTPPHPA